MADGTIYTRVYSNSSAGRLTAAKAAEGNALSETTLLEEFSNHTCTWNREPTALVSCSSRILDTLKRAFDKFLQDEEDPADIWIAFIEVLSQEQSDAVRIHSAQTLAESCELENPDLFLYEFVFEYAIPEEWLLHEVSLQTLLNRGLRADDFSGSFTLEVRKEFARKLQSRDPWEVGLTLGSCARTFGARAPLKWIAWQIFHDCVQVKPKHDYVFKLDFDHGHTERVDCLFFRDLEDGIDTSLIDWWLADIEFIINLEEFKEQQAEAEDTMNEEVISCWATWNDDGTLEFLSTADELSYDEERDRLLVRHEMKRAEIEEEAVQIGL